MELKGMFLPVNVDARLGQHEEPEISIAFLVKDGHEGVVDKHASVGEP